MAAKAPEILVVDDDEVTLVAIADLLETANFKASCHPSPAGAADIAASHSNLAAVVLDLNMPIMRGDNVARLFLSRASLRDLPIVLLSGDTPAALNAVRAKMPNLKVIAKKDMHQMLVPVLREAIAERAQRTERRTWGSEPSATSEQDQTSKAQEHFRTRLGDAVEESRRLWRDVWGGNSQPLPRLVATLRALHGEADRHAMFQAGELLRGVEQIADALQHGAKRRPSAEASVQKAIDMLSTIAKDQAASTPLSTDAITDALRRAALELRSKRDPL